MKYIIANWKMNLNEIQVEDWIKNYRDSSQGKVFKSTIILAPSTPYLEKVYENASALKVQVSSQDVSSFDKGAHTGETGEFQIKDFCTYSIVGHSERKEPRDVVLQKAALCMDAAITPVVCFTNPDEVFQYYKSGYILAWEDPQNISQNGVYREKDPQDIVTSFASMRAKLPENAVLLYGGSVNRQNIQTLVKIHGLDGVLVGNASLDPQHFLDIVASFEDY